MERQGAENINMKVNWSYSPLSMPHPAPPPPPTSLNITTPGDAIASLDKDLFLRPAWGFGYACKSTTTGSSAKLKGSTEKHIISPI